jgi:glycosyltransferase involved in cell wall biosynthesis
MGQLVSLSEIRWMIVCGDEYRGAPPQFDVRLVPMTRELGLGDVRSFWRLYRFFRRQNALAFVQTHTPKASLLGLPAARLAGRPTLYTMHGCFYFKDNSRLGNAAGWLLERWCCGWAKRVLMQSREDFDVVRRVRICSPRKAVHVGNGIDLARFTKVPEPPPIADRPTVVMISRLVEEKGCRDFFRLATELHGKARFVHVGPQETDQHDAISPEEQRSLSEAGYVEFVGSVEDVRPYLAEAHLTVLPSYREGIPRVAMEAAASGRPVVGYNVRGVREVIPPELGLLVRRGDVDALVTLVDELLRNPERLEPLGDACREWVVAEYSEQAVVDRLRRVYVELQRSVRPPVRQGP